MILTMKIYLNIQKYRFTGEITRISYCKDNTARDSLGTDIAGIPWDDIFRLHIHRYVRINFVDGGRRFLCCEVSLL